MCPRKTDSVSSFALLSKAARSADEVRLRSPSYGAMLQIDLAPCYVMITLTYDTIGTKYAAVLSCVMLGQARTILCSDDLPHQILHVLKALPCLIKSRAFHRDMPVSRPDNNSSNEQRLT